MRLPYQTLLLALITLSFLATSCRNPIQAEMDAAERLLDEYPDSALRILSGITDPGNDEEIARHALLTSIAQDRNYITPPNDSLIDISRSFYPIGSKERIRADYYSGRFKFRRGECDEAIKSLIDAEESGLAAKDNLRLGLIYRDLAYIFNNVNDDPNELQYARKAYECFNAVGDTLLIKFAALDYGRALSVGEKTLPQGRELLDSLISVSSSDDVLDMMLRADALRINIGAQILAVFTRHKRNIFDFKTLESHFYDSFPDDFFRSNRSGNGIKDGALEYPLKSGVVLVTIAQPYATEIHDRLNKRGLDLYHREREVLGPEFPYPEYDIFNQQEYSRSIVEDYLTSRHSALMEKEKTSRQRLTLTLWLISFLCVVIVASYIAWRIYAKNRQDRLIMEASELRQLLKSKDRSISGLQEYIDSLYGEKFNMVEELCDLFIVPSKRATEQKRIYDTVCSIVDGFKMDGDRLSEIESFVNRYKDNIATNFKTDFPGLPQRDYILFLYSAAGFSRQAISYLMGDSVDVVSNRKTRLKKRFASFEGKNKEQYLEAMK
ncbi:MAG: hypothetical protein NC248_08560 [Bacteroides sp.]|nr:hypothetical protein [Bacteroides sp.]MCM1390014.1 hypothetical protein [Bacteroides sp.]